MPATDTDDLLPAAVDHDLPWDLRPTELHLKVCPGVTAVPPADFAERVRALVTQRARQRRTSAVASVIVAVLAITVVVHGLPERRGDSVIGESRGPKEKMKLDATVGLAGDPSLQHAPQDPSARRAPELNRPQQDVPRPNVAEQTVAAETHRESRPRWIELSENEMRQVAQGIAVERLQPFDGHSFVVIPSVVRQNGRLARKWMATEIQTKVVPQNHLSDLDRRLLQRTPGGPPVALPIVL